MRKLQTLSDWFRQFGTEVRKQSRPESKRSFSYESLEARQLLTAVVQADYRDDFQFGEPGSGWQYLWNAPADWNGLDSVDASGQRFGLPENYQALDAFGGSFRPRGEAAVDLNEPDRFLRLSETGGRVGAGFQQTASNNRTTRYAIAAWTVQEDGFYEIGDSFLTTDAQSDGIDVVIHVNDQEPVGRHRLLGEGRNFDTALGFLEAGDVIYVGFGGGATDAGDSFTHDFSIIKQDGPGFAVLESDGFTRVSEAGTSDSFDVQLYQRPESEVVIRVTVNDTSELATDQRLLVFTPENWREAQTVTVTGVDDGLSDGTQFTSITADVFEARSDEAFDSVESHTFNSGNLHDENRRSLASQIGEAIAFDFNTVNIVPGEYEIASNSGFGAQLFISYAENLTINAQDVTAIATEQNTAIRLQYSSDVTILGLTVDYAELPFTQGTVTRVAGDGSWLEIRIHDGYALPTNGINSRVITYDSETGEVKANTTTRFNSSVSVLSSRTIRVQSGFGVQDATTVGDYVSLTLPIQTPHAVWVADSERVRLEDVTVHASTSFAFFETGGGANEYIGLTVAPGPRPAGATVDRLLSSNFDAFHSKNTYLGPRIERANFSAMGDDGVAINGDYQLLVRNDGDSIVIARKWNLSVFEIGDRIRVYSESTGRYHEATITGITGAADTGINFAAARDQFLPQLGSAETQFRDGLRLELSNSIPNDVGDLLENVDRNGYGFQVLDSVIENTRARGLAIKADGGTISGNTIRHVATTGILIAPEADFFAESGFASSVTITNNHITDVGYQFTSPFTQDGGGIAIVADPSTSIRGHEDLRIENNLLDRVVGTNITITNASDITIADNVFRQSHLEDRGHGEFFGVDSSALVHATNSDGLTFSDNLIDRPGQFLESPVSFSSPVSNVTGQNTFRQINQATQVVGRGVAYGGSTAFGDLQVDSSIEALLPGQASGVNNLTNFDRGLNRVVIDLADLPRDGLSVDDFEFRVGSTGDPGEWASLDSDSDVPLPTVRTIAGDSPNVTRVVLEWPDNAIENAWLEVTIRANGNTALEANDVFYFGNQIGNVADFNSSAGRPVFVNLSDVRGVLRNLTPNTQGDIGNSFDINRDGRVDQADVDIVFANFARTGGLIHFEAPELSPLA